ncbi:MAG: site-2 protease family protein [Luteitalea sp.]|nr:site-2 protease family protein [Luteitalea sp.]
MPAIVTGLLVLLGSLTIHEMAHAWTADRLGDPTARLLGRISFNPVVHLDPIGSLLLPVIALVSGAPLIGWAKPVPVRVDRLRRGRRDFLWVAAAGPVANIGLAVLAAVLLRLFPFSTEASGGLGAGLPLAMLLMQAVQVNLILAVFNMLPIPPLDGGNVLGALLPDGAAWQFDRVRPYGVFILYGLLLLNVLELIIIPPVWFLMRLLTL